MTRIADFHKVDFGWMKRWWGRSDHLVVVGYNHHTGKYFTLVRRQVREVLAQAQLPTKGRHSPLTKAHFAVAPLGAQIKPHYLYEGSLKVSKTAISHRHFVFVELFEEVSQAEVQPKGYYQEFDADKVSSMFGSYEVAVVKHIIGQAVLNGPSEAKSPLAEVA